MTRSLRQVPPERDGLVEVDVRHLIARPLHRGMNHHANHSRQRPRYGHLLRAHERNGTKAELAGGGGREVADDVWRAGEEDRDDVIDVEFVRGDDRLDELLSALVEVLAFVVDERGCTTDSADSHGLNGIGAGVMGTARPCLLHREESHG